MYEKVPTTGDKSEGGELFVLISARSLLTSKLVLILILYSSARRLTNAKHVIASLDPSILWDFAERRHVAVARFEDLVQALVLLQKANKRQRLHVIINTERLVMTTQSAVVFGYVPCPCRLRCAGWRASLVVACRSVNVKKPTIVSCLSNDQSSKPLLSRLHT